MTTDTDTGSDPAPAHESAPTAATEAAPRRRSTARRALVVSTSALGLLLVLAGAFWGWSALATSQYATAYSSLQTASTEQSAAVAGYDARLRSANNLATRIRSIADAPEFAADTAPEAEPVRASFARLDELVQNPEAFENAPGAEFTDPADDGALRAPWEVLGEAASMASITEGLLASVTEIDTATKATATAEHDLENAETVYFTALANGAQATIDANALSAKSSKVALTRLIEQIRGASSAPSRDGALLSAIVAAEAGVRASEAAEQAHRADPADAVRVEIEDYARSLSNGVTLEFVWAPEVSGLGEGWLSGTAETYSSDGGWSIITLNYGVENDWGVADDARALVAHEVGHTQIFREACSALFSGPAFASDQESWATAWSISQGFDTDGSGIEAYGRPSDEQIAVAGQCR